jgi:hypothetical protein
LFSNGLTLRSVKTSIQFSGGHTLHRKKQWFDGVFPLAVTETDLIFVMDANNHKALSY